MWQRFKAAIEGAGDTNQAAFYPLHSAEGRVVGIADQMTMNYFQESQAPAPTQTALNILLATATRVCILEGGVAGGKAIGVNLLLDEREPKAISTFYACLAIYETAPGLHCMCLGDYAIELYAGDRLAATLGLHHDRSIRWETIWKHDALLRDGLKLLWRMAIHGLSAPLAAFEADRTRAEVAKQAAERWQAAMPVCLIPYWEQMRRDEIELAVLHLTLIRAIPEPLARIQTLLTWFGSGQNRGADIQATSRSPRSCSCWRRHPRSSALLHGTPSNTARRAGVGHRQ